MSSCRLNVTVPCLHLFVFCIAFLYSLCVVEYDFLPFRVIGYIASVFYLLAAIVSVCRVKDYQLIVLTIAVFAGRCACVHYLGYVVAFILSRVSVNFVSLGLAHSTI